VNYESPFIKAISDKVCQICLSLWDSDLFCLRQRKTRH